MPQPFCPGYGQEPFRSLATDFPGPEAYPAAQFRVEWGPIFHRGRLDGSARVLVLGQDPAQHETIVRRILVGRAGRRVQGFLAKLGITRSYVLVNTFLYSVYGSVKASTARGAALVDYRNRWLDALLVGSNVEAVLALGLQAQRAWEAWKATPNGQTVDVAFAHVLHPTYPESKTGRKQPEYRRELAALLRNWNAALATLHPAVQHPDRPTPLVTYAEAFRDGEEPPVPADDFPAGIPAWMRDSGWAERKGTTPEKKRANITLTVPADELP
jgi:uracil-DNA glycosylase